MELIFYVLFCLFVFTAFMYVVSIGLFCFGWTQTPTHVEIDDELTTTVSIIIAARNEEYTIGLCLRALANQSYPVTHMDIIVVDDNSSDTTAKHIQRFCEQYHFIRMIPMNEREGEFGKKKAIEKAIRQSAGELILTTDADCVMGMDWLRIMVSHYKKTKAQLIAGPVCFHREKNMFEKMQSLEFMALITSGAGAIYMNKAVLCNGANLMYTRKAFEEVNGFQDISHGPSGDDVLLMYKIQKRFPGRIKFLKNEDAIVFTKAKKNVQDLLQQRMRWASKKISNLNAETIYLASLVYIFNLLLLILPLLYLVIPRFHYMGPTFYKTCLLIFLVKCVIEFLLLFLAASFFKKRNWLIYFIPEQLVYIPYVIYTGFAGLIGKYDWKGRKIKK